MKVHVQYFAMLREQSGLTEEEVETPAETALDLYAALSDTHSFDMEAEAMKVVVNEKFVDWSHALSDGDEIVFIPPVAGG